MTFYELRITWEPTGGEGALCTRSFMTAVDFADASFRAGDYLNSWSFQAKDLVKAVEIVACEKSLSQLLQLDVFKKFKPSAAGRGYAKEERV